MTGYIVAERKIDDNGNHYYRSLSDAWMTYSLAVQWAEYCDLPADCIISANEPRIIE